MHKPCGWEFYKKNGFSSKSGKAYLLLKYLVEVLYQVIILGKLSFLDKKSAFSGLPQISPEAEF